MPLTEILKKETIIPDLKAADNAEAIGRLVEVLVDAGVLRRDLREKVEKETVEREKVLGTGMEHGVAVPHACIAGIEVEMGAFGKAKKGVDFGAEDGTLSDLIFLLIIPCESMSIHVRRLSEIVKVLNVEDNREKIRRAETADDIYRIFSV